MILTSWLAATAASILYALLLSLSDAAAHDAAPVFIVIAVAAWAVLARHLNRRRR